MATPSAWRSEIVVTSQRTDSCRIPEREAAAKIADSGIGAKLDLNNLLGSLDAPTGSRSMRIKVLQVRTCGGGGDDERAADRHATRRDGR